MSTVTGWGHAVVTSGLRLMQEADYSIARLIHGCRGSHTEDAGVNSIGVTTPALFLSLTSPICQKGKDWLCRLRAPRRTRSGLRPIYCW